MRPEVASVAPHRPIEKPPIAWSRFTVKWVTTPTSAPNPVRDCCWFERARRRSATGMSRARGAGSGPPRIGRGGIWRRRDCSPGRRGSRGRLSRHPGLADRLTRPRVHGQAGRYFGVPSASMTASVVALARGGRELGCFDRAQVIAVLVALVVIVMTAR